MVHLMNHLLIVNMKVVGLVLLKMRFLMRNSLIIIEYLNRRNMNILVAVLKMRIM